MEKISTIVAATDLSPGSLAAVERAAQLARAHGASLHLLHVFDDSAWHSLREVFDLAPLLQDPTPGVAARERLAQLAGGLRERFGIEVYDKHGVGAVPQGIADHVRESGAALLVIGPRADPSIPGLGQVAAKLLRAPACPVLVVRTAGAQPYRSVLSAVDVTEEQERTAQAAVALFPDARHQLLYALDPALDPASWTGRLGDAELAQRHGDIQRAAVQRLESIGTALAASAKRAIATEVRIDKPARAVAAAAQACQADCVAVGHHRRRGTDEAILGALAEHLARHAAGDVLVVP